MDELLEQLTILGKQLVEAKADEMLLFRMRRAYALIKKYNWPPKSAIETIGLPKETALKLFQFIPSRPVEETSRVSKEMLEFIQSCIPTEEEIAETRYWQSIQI